MKIKGNTVFFDSSDKSFIKKFGFSAAADMVMDFRSQNKLPFIYDLLQLSGFLSVDFKDTVRFLKKGCDNDYRTLTIKKRNGNDRILNVPSPTLKRCQRIIYNEILKNLPVSKYAKAYKKGVHLQDNASPHVGKKYILKIDITDFFGSITFREVYSAAFNTRYFPRHVGYVLTVLCCKDEALPQGAPTSPALSNLVMKGFDENIGKWCEARGISYTRYCDDMTFSSDEPLYHVYKKVTSLLEEADFSVNQSKTKFITNASRQSVTGLTVNQKVSVNREYKRTLRQELHYLFLYGAENCLIKTDNKQYFTNGKPDKNRYLSSLEGRIVFVLSVEKDNPYFKTALEKLRALY
ncbi:MAG: retron St85 family RNA-directed DNA polymerase [Clostridia bacterium]|nr:retron St85 family RNA-directed DNA polymerase [Clostridia bacterium]